MNTIIRIKIGADAQAQERIQHFCAPCADQFSNNDTKYLLEIDFQRERNFLTFQEQLTVKHLFYEPRREEFKGGFRMCLKHGERFVELLQKEKKSKFVEDRWLDISLEEFINRILLPL